MPTYFKYQLVDEADAIDENGCLKDKHSVRVSMQDAQKAAVKSTQHSSLGCGAACARLHGVSKSRSGPTGRASGLGVANDPELSRHTGSSPMPHMMNRKSPRRSLEKPRLPRTRSRVAAPLQIREAAKLATPALSTVRTASRLQRRG